MYADDMGYGDFGFSNPAVRTPALDQLADSGLCLTQQYAGAPVCSPSRAALLTGRHAIRTGAITPAETLGYDRISLAETTIADHLKAAGYATGMVGKWHNGALDSRYHPNARGFDEFVGFRGGWMDYWNWWLDRNGSITNGDGTYLTQVLGDAAVDFIERHANEPYFLAVPFNAPHTPLQAPQQLVDSYLQASFRLGVATTYAMIEAMDTQVARILQAVRDSGAEDNTIVMFTSDNGPAFNLRADMAPPDGSLDTSRFNCNFAGAKGSVYEGGIRVPMLIRWPGRVTAGATSDHLVHFTDWLPTILEWTSATRNFGLPLDGVDVSSVLDGGQPNTPPRFWQFNMYSPIGVTNAAMRDGQWKLVRPAMNIAFASAADKKLADDYVERDIAYKYRRDEVPEAANWPEPNRIVPEPPAPELYNIDEDPSESRNVAAEHPDLTRRMLTAVETWFEEVESERRSIPGEHLFPPAIRPVLASRPEA